jgi:hypothetical protein
LILSALANPWFWCKAYNQIESAAVNSAVIDLTVLDFYFYVEWLRTQEDDDNGACLCAYYLDLHSAKDVTGWKNHLTLKGLPPKGLVFFLLQGFFHWPKLVIFNFEANMVLILGQANNLGQFQGHADWTRWKGDILWDTISQTMSWRDHNQPPRVIEANWIPVSI